MMADIDTLRELAGRIKAVADDSLMNDAAAGLISALDENERLRAALTKIDDGYGPDHLSMYCRDIARAFRAHP